MEGRGRADNVSLLQLFMALGGGGVTFFPSISNQTISGACTSPCTATAGWQANANGHARKNINGTWSNIAGEWLRPSFDGDEADRFEVRATEFSQSGAATRTGTMNTWQPLTLTRSWTIVTSTGGVKDWVIDFEIREIADTGNTDTARITMLVEEIF